jgi:hypothetical protein
MDPHDAREKRVEQSAMTDSTGVTPVVLATAYAEHYLDALIAWKMDKPEAFFNDDPNWFVDLSIRIRLADAFNLLPPRFSSFFKAVVRLRNKCAHKIDHAIQPNEIQTIEAAWLKSVPDREGAYWRDNYRSMVGESGGLYFLLNRLVRGLHFQYARRADHERLAVLHQRFIDNTKLLVRGSGITDEQIEAWANQDELKPIPADK